ncbi:NAD(P)H-hydrate dehydratase [Maricaulis salignorans]|uniref:NAD(P)H-hydrate dehydratase n=1 Tax=Maricaulis salignorans TaxID=144026 RepID=UPI003A8F5E15
MMPLDVLKTADCGACDRFAASAGVPGSVLMEAAGLAVARAIRTRWARRPALILCGPGNNGGDGFVCARILRQAGWPVRVALLGDPAGLKGDAAAALELWDGPVEAMTAGSLGDAGLVVDAIFGAGLSRPLEGVAAQLAIALAERSIPVIAVDLPSGIGGDRPDPDGITMRADLTVTFHARKPAHCLEPAASLCGERVVADIGIPAGWRDAVTPLGRINQPALWHSALPTPEAGTHKHQRGRLVVFSGGASSTGAARLAAMAGLRAGAGLVTLASPGSAMLVNAGALTAVMLKRWDGEADSGEFLTTLRASAAVMGPAAGVGEPTRRAVCEALVQPAPLVLDADALTSFENRPEVLFERLRPIDVITPHVGEFERLFPGLLTGSENRIDAVIMAARLTGCVVLLKGADTVIAAPGQGVVINRHASPALATAGSGDVLAGLIGGLLAQSVGPFDAACAAAWLHGDAGLRLGAGLTAEDIPGMLPNVLQALAARCARARALRRLSAKD